MSNNNLPPELVEKMAEAWSQPNSVQACAQIAVDYADEVSENYINDLSQISDENELLRIQRDELLDCLEGYKCTVNLMQETFNTSMGDSMLKEHNELLKKHEDGKE